MMLALAIVLPFFTGQLKTVGKMLCPMHIPVIICGFFCGPVYGLAVGLIAPLLRFALFGMPVIYPSGIGMCVELATYGFVSGFMYKILPKKKINIYVSLLSAMLSGRILWGLARGLMYGLGGSEFGMKAFLSGAFLDSIPGIIIQIVIIPIIVMMAKRLEIGIGDRR